MPKPKAKKERPAKAASQLKPRKTSPGKPVEPSQAQQKLDFRLTLNRVREHANRGDQRARQAIRQCIKASPGLCKEFGDVARHAETALVKLISGGEILTSAAITQQAAKMRQELAGPAPTLLEEMAVERIVACWLQLQHCETQFLHSQTSVQWARYWLARQAQADRLYRMALKSLASVRELLSAKPHSGGSTRVETGEPVPARPDCAAGLDMPKFGEEPPRANGGHVNRIAALAAFHAENAKNGVAAGLANGKSRLNGHGNRLTELLGTCAKG